MLCHRRGSQLLLALSYRPRLTAQIGCRLGKRGRACRTFSCPTIARTSRSPGARPRPSRDRASMSVGDELNFPTRVGRLLQGGRVTGRPQVNRKMLNTAAAAVAIALSACMQVASAQETLTVMLSGVKRAKGSVRVGVCDDPKKPFPGFCSAIWARLRPGRRDDGYDHRHETWNLRSADVPRSQR